MIGGVDIWDIPEEQYRNIVATVFQNFKLFSFSLGENLSLEKAYDKERAERVLKQVGFSDRLQKSPKGLDSILFQDYEEEGFECSGGEAQKIALARCLYSDAPILILDEPTSALDARGEMEVYENFNNACGSKTAIFISHRLSSCRFSDRILVFEKGHIVQNGTHKELIRQEDSLYWKLWNAQAQYYR